MPFLLIRRLQHFCLPGSFIERIPSFASYSLTTTPNITCSSIHIVFLRSSPTNHGCLVDQPAPQAQNAILRRRRSEKTKAGGNGSQGHSTDKAHWAPLRVPPSGRKLRSSNREPKHPEPGGGPEHTPSYRKGCLAKAAQRRGTRAAKGEEPRPQHQHRAATTRTRRHHAKLVLPHRLPSGERRRPVRSGASSPVATNLATAASRRSSCSRARKMLVGRCFLEFWVRLTALFPWEGYVLMGVRFIWAAFTAYGLQAVVTAVDRIKLFSIPCLSSCDIREQL